MAYVDDDDNYSIYRYTSIMQLRCNIHAEIGYKLLNC